MEKPRKGLTVEECIKKARKYIKKYGVCLLWFDVVRSRDFPDATKLVQRLKAAMKSLNYKFGKHFPKNNLAVMFRAEKGFQVLHGDCSWVGIDNAEIIPEIIRYQKEKYPDIPLWWGVAKDGYKDEDWDD
jgi:hypothetical protein